MGPVMISLKFWYQKDNTPKPQNPQRNFHFIGKWDSPACFEHYQHMRFGVFVLVCSSVIAPYCCKRSSLSWRPTRFRWLTRFATHAAEVPTLSAYLEFPSMAALCVEWEKHLWHCLVLCSQTSNFPFFLGIRTVPAVIGTPSEFNEKNI